MSPNSLGGLQGITRTLCYRAPRYRFTPSFNLLRCSVARWTAKRLAKEQWRNSTEPKLSAKDAYLVRRVFLEGAEAESLAAAWKQNEKEFVRQMGTAARKLKQLVRNEVAPATARRSKALPSEREVRTPPHQRPAILGWQPLRPPLRPTHEGLAAQQ